MNDKEIIIALENENKLLRKKIIKLRILICAVTGAVFGCWGTLIWFQLFH